MLYALTARDIPREQRREIACRIELAADNQLDALRRNQVEALMNDPRLVHACATPQPDITFCIYCTHLVVVVPVRGVCYYRHISGGGVSQADCEQISLEEIGVAADRISGLPPAE